MASEASRKKAKELCYFEHDSRHDDKCGNCALIAAALDEARAEGEAKATAKLHDLLSAAWAALDPEEHPELCGALYSVLNCGTDGSDGPCAQYQRDLDNARAEGRAEGERIGAERERWECHRIASDFSDRIGGSAGAVAIRIAGRGPMRGPEEGE